MDILVLYWHWVLLLCLFSYVVGSITFAIIFSRAFCKVDIRTMGSGNAGTTNMFRIFGMSLGVLTFFCDVSKAVLCCLLAKLMFYYIDSSYMLTAGYIAGLFVVIGHIYTIFYKAKGGKGVATGVGVLFCLQPILGLIILVPTLLVLLFSDRMSVLALALNTFLIIWHWAVLYGTVSLTACVCMTILCLLIIIAHRQNIYRLIHGTEPPLKIRNKIFGKKNKSTEQDN